MEENEGSGPPREKPTFDPFADPSFYRYTEEQLNRFDQDLPWEKPIGFLLRKHHLLHLLYMSGSIRNANFEILSTIRELSNGNLDEARKHFEKATEESLICENNFRRFFEGILDTAQVIDG